MIAVDKASARFGSVWIANVSMAWGPGIHSVVGGRDDGGNLLLAVAAGAVATRRGRVRVLGRAPTDPAIRRQIGYVPLAPALPADLLVREFLAIAAGIRREAPWPAHERLVDLGLTALADRPIRSLSHAEARALSLAEATTSSSVQALLIEEPRAVIDPQAAGRLPSVLRAKARNGCSVVVCTASLRDAADLADDHTVMHRGAMAAHLRSLDEVVGFAPQGARLQVLLRSAGDARAMVASLAHDTSVDAIERDGAVVRLRGPDPVWLARAAAAAALEAGIDVVELGVAPPTADEARAAAAGIAAATYEAAYRRTRASAAAEAPSPEDMP
ncbi:MAG: hypothetical protein FWD17_03550 [Polyangiaceae bacterium]|nr:hypothetical protein [Polyangiaceae bacterium]